jgi:NAD+ dependent glucose-6-phosphate dehydrogenase
MKVAITGANGEIGRVLAPYLARQHQVRLAAWDLPPEREPAASESASRVDIRDAAAVSAFVQGADAVVHLAAEREIGADWDELRGPNIEGTFNIFDASARLSVPKIVFASSCHVTGGYGFGGDRGLIGDRGLAGHHGPAGQESALTGEGGFASERALATRRAVVGERRLDGTEAVRPDSLYGVTKAFGEALGRFTADRYGISVICLRLGWFLSAPHNEESMRMWLSPGDLCRLVSAALVADVPYGIYYGASANARGLWDLGPAMTDLGYQPEDNSELFADYLTRHVHNGT